MMKKDFNELNLIYTHSGIYDNPDIYIYDAKNTFNGERVESNLFVRFGKKDDFLLSTLESLFFIGKINNNFYFWSGTKKHLINILI